MSYDAYAVLFVGIRAEDAIKRETITDEVTKYNEDTGEPYQQKKSRTKMTLFGREVTDPQDLYVEEAWFALGLDNEVPGLQVCCPTSEPPSDQLIGCSLARIGTGEETSVHEATVGAVSNALAKVKKSLQALGYSGPEPRVFLVFEESS